MDPCPEPTDVQEESCVFLSSAVLEPAWSPRRELWQQPPAAVTVSVPPGTESLPLCGQGTAQAYKHPRVTPPQMRDLGSCFVAVPAPAGRGPFAAPSETWVQSRQADPAPEAGPGRILGSCGGCQACFRVSPGCHILSGRGARVWAVRWSRLCPGWGWGWWGAEACPGSGGPDPPSLLAFSPEHRSRPASELWWVQARACSKASIWIKSPRAQGSRVHAAL